MFSNFEVEKTSAKARNHKTSVSDTEEHGGESSDKRSKKTVDCNKKHGQEDEEKV